MAERRLTNHQQFDVISCKQCNNIYNDARLLDCLHSFCRTCLQAYATENITTSVNVATVENVVTSKNSVTVDNIATSMNKTAIENNDDSTHITSVEIAPLVNGTSENVISENVSTTESASTSENITTSENAITMENVTTPENAIASENVTTAVNTTTSKNSTSESNAKSPSNATSENQYQSTNTITCPLCQEETTLDPEHGISGLLKNVLLERYIIQAHRDKTMIVAEREVLHMEEQALNEDELRDENIQECIKNIAETAGTVIADAVEDQSRLHDFETVKYRQVLQQNMTNLQETALDIVYAIDRVNHGIEDWVDQRTRACGQIKQRSMELQGIIRGIERKLLAKVENRDLENEVKTEAFHVKGQLHKKLKGTLNTVDFLKLLIEFGDKDDLIFYRKVAEDRTSNLLKSGVTVEETTFNFSPPRIDTEDGLQLMFGSLLEAKEERKVWDPTQSERQSEIFEDSSQSPNSDVESHHTLTADSDVQYSEENEHIHDVNMNKMPRYPSQKPGRRPIRSVSFHTSRSHFDPMLKYRSNVSQSNSQEFPAQNDTTTSLGTANRNITENKSNMSSAIQSLAPDKDFTMYPEHISRRLSAPPSTIINTLAQRRLSALSILERANISTARYNFASNDVEVGLNQARLEWIRDSVRKRASAKKKTTANIDVEKA